MINISTFLYLYLISIPLFILFETVWLGVIARSFYQNRLEHVLGDMNWVAAVVFALIFLAGLTFFAIYPSITKGTPLTALVLGGLFGLFTYSAYDLMNLTMLRNWPLSVAFVDIFWGTLLSALVAVFTMLIFNRITT